MRENRGDTIPPDVSPHRSRSPLPLLAHPDTHAPSTTRNRLVRTFLLAALGIEIVVVGLLYVPIPPNPDQELYDYMAWSARAQGGLYRTAGDVNMPGEALRHIAAMTIFGNHYWSYRMFDYIVLVGLTAAVALLCRRYYGSLYASLFFGLYPVVYTTSGYWMTGQRDLLATHDILLAGLAYLRRVEAGGVPWLLLAGAAMAEAVLLKPTYLVFAPLLLAAVALSVRGALKRQLTDATILAAAGASVLGSVILLGWATHSLRDWYEMTIIYSSQNYMGGTEMIEILRRIASSVIRYWHWFTVMALSGLLCWLFERHRTPLSVILAVLATVIISTLVQRKGFGYHFGGVLVVTSLLCAFYLAEIIRLARRIPDARLRYSVLSFPLILVLSGLLSKADRELTPQLEWYLNRSRFLDMLHVRSFDDVMQAAHYARSETGPGDAVWTYSSHLMINSLAERPLPTRFANYVLLRASRASPLAERWRQEVEAVFRQQPPALIVLERADPTDPEGYIYMYGIRPDEPLSALKEAVKRLYVPDRQIGRFAFFRRATNPATAATANAMNGNH